MHRGIEDLYVTYVVLCSSYTNDEFWSCDNFQITIHISFILFIYGVSNHQPHNRLLKGLFRLRSKKTPKPRVTGLCEGGSLVTGEFPAQRASYTEKVSRTKASDTELRCFLWSAPWINGWINNREAGDLRCHRAHYGVIVMFHVERGISIKKYKLIHPMNYA